jgi:hypothetical protein
MKLPAGLPTAARVGPTVLKLVGDKDENGCAASGLRAAAEESDDAAHLLHVPKPPLATGGTA